MGMYLRMRCLKEELSWAIDKQLWIINNIMLFETGTAWLVIFEGLNFHGISTLIT